MSILASMSSKFKLNHTWMTNMISIFCDIWKPLSVLHWNTNLKCMIYIEFMFYYNYMYYQMNGALRFLKKRKSGVVSL